MKAKTKNRSPAVRRGAWMTLAAALLLPQALSAAGDGQAHLDKGKAALDKGDVKAAVIELKNALQQDPSLAQARLLLGRVYLRGDDDQLRCLLPGGREDWSRAVPASIGVKSSPTVTPGGQVLVGDESGHVVAFDARGQELWRREVGEGPVPPPAVAEDGTLYVATAEGRLVSLDSGGEVRWEKDLGGVFEVSPFVGRDGRVYLHDTRERFLALEPDGTVRWSREFDERLSRQPAVDAQGRVFLNVDNQLWRLGPEGEVEWKFQADAGDELWTAPVLRDDGSLLMGARSGKVYGIKPIDQQFAEEREALEKGTGPAHQPGDIAPSEDGFIRIGGIRLPVKG